MTDDRWDDAGGTDGRLGDIRDAGGDWRDGSPRDDDRGGGRKRISATRWMLTSLFLVPVGLLWIALLTGKLRTFEVVSASMDPALAKDDRVLVFTGRLPADLRGRVVAFKPPPGQEGDLLTKRVVAEEGDTVSVKNGNLYVDATGDPLPGPEILNHRGRRQWEVPAGQVFVVGDNRNNSLDSREYGPIPRDSVIGVVSFRVLPVGKFGRVK